MNISLHLQENPPPVCINNNAMKIIGRFLLLLIVCVGCLPAQSQQAKSVLQLADEYFAGGEYYTAAHLYEQYLNPPKKQKTVSDFPLNIKGRRSLTNNNVSRTDILFKQAESYRLAHYWQDAANSYKMCLEKSAAQYGDALYWHAVCDRSLGNYLAAEESLKQFLSGAGKNNPYKVTAEKELQTIQFIRQQLSRPDSVLVKLQKLDVPNSSVSGAFAPVHMGGAQFLISSTQKDTVVNGANPYNSHLYYANLNEGGMENLIPVSLSKIAPMINQGAAGISIDGNYLYLTQWKKVNGTTVSSIYFARKEGNSWSAPIALPLVNIKGHSSKQPFCSLDGKYLFFSSDRPGGSGKFDIWLAPIKSDGTTGEPVNAGSVINSNDDELAPFYHNNSATLVFASNRWPGMGGYDLFAAKGSETSWNTPENMGHPVNSSRDDIYFFAPEKAGLLSNAIFSSDRGTGCCLETYRISKAPKNKLLAGTIRDCKDHLPVADATIVLKDASGEAITTTTDANGKYAFNLKSPTGNNMALSITKELYNDTLANSHIVNTDETDLLIDKLINEDLCIELTPEKKPEEVLVIKAEDVVTVYFDFDKSILRTEVVNKLDSIYAVMAENIVATIQISGYTDGLGSVEYNKKLSDRRARAVAEYLIQKGIDASRISFVSFGACCPVEMELINGRDNADGRSRNRRALINIKKD